MKKRMKTRMSNRPIKSNQALWKHDCLLSYSLIMIPSCDVLYAGLVMYNK